MPRDERAPRRPRRSRRRQLERDLARPGQLALDREQADPDADRPRVRPARPLSRATSAMSSPSPTGRIVAVKRGSARTAASNARSAAVFASSAATGRVPDDAAAPQDVVGDDERARREPGDERLEVAPGTRA